MRVFIGIKFDESTRADIEKFLKPFKKIGTPIKWVKPENVHLTLKFIGEVSPEKFAQIEDAITSSDFAVGAFDLKIVGCGKFGRGSELNIFWIGIDKNEKIENLYQKIEDALQKVGISREEREFKPHLTVGRNKKRFNFKPLFQMIGEKADLPLSQFQVKAFQIFKSELFPTGPVYTVLKEISLDSA